MGNATQIGRLVAVKAVLGVAILLGSLAHVRAQEQAPPKAPEGEPIASNDRYRVDLLSLAGATLGLEVRGPQNELVWETQPSSTEITVSLAYERIVIFTKTHRPGRRDEGKQGETRGGTMYTLAGKKVGVISDDFARGEFAGPIFVAKGAAGVAAYGAETGAELWRNQKLRFTWVKDYGTNVVCLRDGGDQRFVNYLCEVSTGRIVHEFSTPRDNDGMILAVSGPNWLTLQTVTDDLANLGYTSEIRTGDRRVGRIVWEGQPLAAAFSAEAKSVAAICARLEKDGKEPRTSYLLEEYNVDGKLIQRQVLLKADAEQVLEAKIRFDGTSISTSLTRNNVLIQRGLE